MITTITLAFADGEYEFGLPLAQINEVQNRLGAGIGEVYARVLRGRVFQLTPSGQVAVGNPLEGAYRIEDITTVIRQGLIGGGRGTVDGVPVKVDPRRANELVESYVLAPNCPLKDGWALAAAILAARIEGYTPAEAPPAPTPDKKKEAQPAVQAGSTMRRRSRAAR